MPTYFVTYLPAGAAADPDWAEIHADSLAEVAELATSRGWRIMSLHDTNCWRPKLRVEVSARLEALELDRFLHYHRRGHRADPDWLAQVRERLDALRQPPFPH